MTEFIPLRRFSLLVVFLVGLMPIAAVTAVFVCRDTFLQDSNRLAVAGLELYGRGTITAWLASMMMMAGALICLMIYNTRRHRTDDYRGSYCIWLWAAVFFVVVSIDTVAGLHHLLQAGFVALFRDVAMQYGARCWLTMVGLLIGGMSIRAMVDMRQCRGACLTMLLGLVGITMSGLHYLNVYRVFLGQTGIMLMVTMFLVGQFLIVYSLIMYARYVFRVAQGDIQVVARTRKKKTKHDRGDRSSWFRRREKSAKKKSKLVRKANRQPLDLDEDDQDAYEEIKSRTTSRRGATVPQSENDVGYSADSEMDEMDVLANPNLTKAERRKLRKKLRRDRQRAA